MAEATPILVGVTTPPGRGYYNPPRDYNTSDNTRGYHGTDRNPSANSGFVPTQGAKSTPVANRNANAANKGAGGVDGGDLWCDGAKDQDMTSRTAGQQGASMSSLHSRAR